jgi:hypothetical protein
MLPEMIEKNLTAERIIIIGLLCNSLIKNTMKSKFYLGNLNTITKRNQRSFFFSPYYFCFLGEPSGNLI